MFEFLEQELFERCLASGLARLERRKSRDESAVRCDILLRQPFGMHRSNASRLGDVTHDCHHFGLDRRHLGQMGFVSPSEFLICDGRRLIA